MNKLLAVIILSVSLSACSMASIESTTVDNQPCNASYVSIFKSSDSIDMSACGAQGNATGSQADELSQAILSAAIKGLSVAK